MQHQLRLLAKATDGQLVREHPLPLVVLEFESPSAAIIATPVPALSRKTTLYVFLLVMSVLVASGLIRIDKIVSASGKLVAKTPNIVVQSFGESIVESIEVREGDVVREGQILARLNPTFATADLTTIKNQVDLLAAKAGRLQALTAGTDYAPDPSNPLAPLQASIFKQQTAEHALSLQNYNQQIERLQTKIAGGESLIAYYRERVGIADKLEEMRQRLEDLQYGTRVATLTAKDDRLNMAAKRDQAASEAAQASRELIALRADRDAYAQRWNGQNSQELAETRSLLVQAQQAYEKASLNSHLRVLTAPRDAVVLSVGMISPGSIVTSGAPLLRLVPIDAPLVAEIAIPGIDSGYVRPGETVRIKFDTLPFLQYGSALGVVRAISADSFSPETAPQEGGSLLPNRPRTLYYRGDVTLDTVQLHDTPQGFRLMPGMPLTADVKVGTRSVLAYFIGKIIPIAQDSLHEP
ncbi:MAG TPA: HlyD family type I secretion periplasmic adaptor subunit [Acetobacteraceae bacterium]|nr:HlyD family type I secretion periplasmic adaptor subunit [Acetobacteraceae bacterium]